MSKDGTSETTCPLTISRQEWENRWDTAFGKKNQEATEELKDNELPNLPKQD